MATLIKNDIGADSELVEGGRGEFTVWVGDKMVAQKDSHGFPSDDQVLAAVQQALGR